MIFFNLEKRLTVRVMMGEEGLSHRTSPVDRAQCRNCLAPDLTHTRIKNPGLLEQKERESGETKTSYKQGRYADAPRPIRHSFNTRQFQSPHWYMSLSSA